MDPANVLFLFSFVLILKHQWVAAKDNSAKQTVESLKKALTDVSDALVNDAENLSSASMNVTRGLAEVSLGVG